MPRMHNAIIQDRVTLTAAAQVIERDLPINPISYLTLTLRGLNNGVDAIPLLSTILSKISNFEVLLDNKQLVQGNLQDLAALTFGIWAAGPDMQPRSRTDNEIFHASLHIPFGRKPWHPTEALPATRKGDLAMRVTTIADPAGIDTMTLTVEARQVLDSDPEAFLKYVTSNFTPTVAGVNDLDIVTGPDYLGVLFFGTTVPTAAAETASLARISLRVDDVEHLIPETRWETLSADTFKYCGRPLFGLEHAHQENVAAAYTQLESTTPGEIFDQNLWNNYAFMDFDPHKDGTYRLITRGRSRANFRITGDVADLIRIIPVELVPLVAAPA